MLDRGGWSTLHPSRFPPKQLHCWNRNHRYGHSILGISSNSHGETERDISWVIIVLTPLLYTQNMIKLHSVIRENTHMGRVSWAVAAVLWGNWKVSWALAGTGWVVHLNYFSTIICPYTLCLLFLCLKWCIFYFLVVPLNLFKIITSDLVQHALPWGQSHHIST